MSFTDQLSSMETCTSDAFPTSGTVANIAPTVTLSGTSQAVEEGNDPTFTLKLDEAAPIDLTVDVTVSETEDMVAGTDEESWRVTVMEDQTQATFTVATQNDDVDEADSVVTVTVMADGDTPATCEVGTPSEATVTVTDNDTRDVVVSGSPLTVNENGTGAYTVVLTSQPTGEVTITPSLSDNPDVTFTPATLTFTADNWGTAQTVMVSAAQDADSMNDTATITHTVAGADYGDSSVTAASVAVTVSEVVLPVVSIAAVTSPVSEGAPVGVHAEPDGRRHGCTGGEGDGGCGQCCSCNLCIGYANLRLRDGERQRSQPCGDASAFRQHDFRGGGCDRDSGHAERPVSSGDAGDDINTSRGFGCG